VRKPLAALKPPVAIPASESTDASVRAPVTPMSPFRAKTGSEARIEGNEKGVQLPVANDRSKTVPSAARSESTGEYRSLS